MEPVSAVIGIASGAAGLVAIIGEVVTFLIALRGSHRNAEVMVLDLISTCQAYETAWSRLQQWALQASDDPHSGNNESVLAQLVTFLEVGRAIMDLIRKDIGRISPTSKRDSWWRTGTKPKGSDAVQLLLHQKTILEHCDRIHRQNTSLNLLISVLTLPSKPLQEAAVEVLRPKFRKDEETAWTIVNSKLSPGSRKWPTTLASSGRSSFGSITSILSYRRSPCGNFSFEDDLFAGPVYKRLLITKLCEQPTSNARAMNTSHNSTKRIREPAPAPSITQNQDEFEGHAVYSDDTLALELRREGIFSRSVHEDFCEFMACYRPRKMEQRHLPLASVLCQQDRDHEEQNHVDDRFFDAVRRRDIASVADALDDGADINCRRSSQSALELCVEHWVNTKAESLDLPSEDTTIAEFLMLYKEIHIPYMFASQLSILHLCVHIGATAKFMRPFLNIEGGLDALNQLDKFGRSVLHAAVLSSTSGHFALAQLKTLCTIQPDYILDKNGVDALSFAERMKASDHIAILSELAGKEYSPVSYPASSDSTDDIKHSESCPRTPDVPPCETLDSTDDIKHSESCPRTSDVPPCETLDVEQQPSVSSRFDSIPIFVQPQSPHPSSQELDQSIRPRPSPSLARHIQYDNLDKRELIRAMPKPRDIYYRPPRINSRSINNLVHVLQQKDTNFEYDDNLALRRHASSRESTANNFRLFIANP